MSMAVSKVLRNHVALFMLVPLIVGIFFELQIPEVLNISVLMVSTLVLFFLTILFCFRFPLNKIFGSLLFVEAFVLMFSLGSFSLSQTKEKNLENLCYNKNNSGVLVAHLSSEVKGSDYGSSCFADLYNYNDSLHTISDDWRVKCKLNFHCFADTLEPGDIIMIPKKAVATSELNDFAMYSYNRYLSLRGVQSVCTIDTFGYVSHTSHDKLKDKALSVNNYLKGELKGQKLLTREEQNLVSALVLGDKESIKGTELRDTFSAIGASHVLAVSGLHVGIVVLMLSCVFGLVEWSLRKPKWFKWLRFLLMLSSLWMYAYITGLAPSIVRTSIMFTIYFVLSAFVSRRVKPHNVVAITAFSMLVYNPYYLFDLGFQFSFIAVASIMMFLPILNLKRDKYQIKMYMRESGGLVGRVFEKIEEEKEALKSRMKGEKISLFVWFRIILLGTFRYFLEIEKVTISAQIMLLPFLLYYFQNFSLLSFVSSLVVIPLATLLIPATFLYFGVNAVFGSGVVADSMAGVVSFLSGMMIDSTSYLSGWEMLKIKNISFDYVDLVVVSGIILMVYFFLRTKSKYWFVVVVLSLFCYTGYFAYDVESKQSETSLAVYNVYGTTAIHCREKGKNVIITNDYDKVYNKVSQYFVRERLSNPKIEERVAPFYIGDSLVYVLSERLPKVQEGDGEIPGIKPLRVNTLILQNNTVRDYELLNRYFEYEHLVVDATNTRKTNKYWQELRDSTGIDCHVVRFDGSYKYEY